MEAEKGSAEGTIRPTAGMHVKSRFHEEWGQGMVYQAQGESVRVLFPNHPDKKPVLVPVKSLVVVRAGKWAEAATKVQEREEQVATKSRAKPAKAAAAEKVVEAAPVAAEAVPAEPGTPPVDQA